MLGGVTTTVKVAHIRLCHSRMFLVRAYPRETQEIMFDAARAAPSRLFGGMCRRGIYDNMATAYRSRVRRQGSALQPPLSSDVLALPGRADRSRTPAAGWEKGQVENQVGNAARAPVRRRGCALPTTPSSTPGWRRAASPRRARAHPEQTDRTVWEVFLQAEQAGLIHYCWPARPARPRNRGRGVEEQPGARFDHNRRSVAVKAARRTAQLRVYAERIVVCCDGEIVGEHRRRFGRGQAAYDPWHYLPVLAEARCAWEWRPPSATGTCRRLWRRSAGGSPVTVTAIASSSIS